MHQPTQIRLLITIATTFTAITTLAQSLRGKQTAGLAAPTGIMINGALDEWGSTFQAYDKEAMVFYSIANDAENIYLLHPLKGPINW